MNDKVRGIVLSLSDYKEADVLMQVITLEYGFISLVGKAAKKLDSKNHFLPMCEYEFIIDYKDGKTIYSIHGHKLLNNFFESNDIVMMSFKNIMLELALKNKEINSYNELLFLLKTINNQNKYLLGSLYFSYITKQFGIMPEVDHCVMCSNKKVVSLSNRAGGFLCFDHSNGISESVETLKKFRMIVKANFSNYDVLKDFVYDLSDFKLICSFYLENSDARLKTYDFYLSLV